MIFRSLRNCFEGKENLIVVFHQDIALRAHSRWGGGYRAAASPPQVEI